MRVLVVEDEKSLARAISTILKRNNYTVDVAENGSIALDFLKNGLYDVVVMDVMMPVMDGIQALKEIRASNNFVPVIMLTAKAQVDDKVLGLDSGANDYLTKPFDARELLARIRVVTRKENVMGDILLKVGNVSLDSTKYMITTPYGSLELANKQYQIMEMFMRNVGRAITVEQMMDKIWGYDSDSEINSVWAHLSYLRKKLESINANVRIVTKRNLGYILEIVDE